MYCKGPFIFVIGLCILCSCAHREIKAPPKQARVALVLGAGASKGFAHIGVLKVLEANKIPVRRTYRMARKWSLEKATRGRR
jgi:hypothetical protein